MAEPPIAKKFIESVCNTPLDINETSGIYALINRRNFKFYIGSTVNLRNRKRAHFSALRRKGHYCVHLQRSYNLYGEVFEFRCVEYCDGGNLVQREQYWLDRFWDLGCLYNEYSLARRVGVASFGTEKKSKKIFPQCIVKGCNNSKNHGRFCNSHWTEYYFGMVDSFGSRLRDSKKGKKRYMECSAKNSGSGECSSQLVGKFCTKHKNQYALGIIDKNGNKLREIRKGAMIYYECMAKNAGTGECGGRKFGRFCRKHDGQYRKGVINKNGEKLRDFHKGCRTDLK